MNEKHERHELDYYITPPGLAELGVLKTVHRHSPHSLKDRKTTFLEPGCGEFAPFADAACEYFSDVTAVDIMQKPEGAVEDEIDQRYECDFLYPNWSEGKKFDLIVGNPPFKDAAQFILQSLKLLEHNGTLAFLLRLCFLASIKRIPFFRDYPPNHVTVLAKRPSFFVENSRTDGQDYGFFFWRGGMNSPIRQLGSLHPTTLDWINNSDKYYNLPYLLTPEERQNAKT